MSGVTMNRRFASAIGVARFVLESRWTTCWRKSRSEPGLTW